MRSCSNRSIHNGRSAIGASDGQLQPPSSRGDTATESSCESPRRRRSLPDAKSRCSSHGSGCCGSQTDELSKLELRLAAMESRLSDFEALLMRSCARSVSGDTSSNLPGSSATNHRGDTAENSTASAGACYGENNASALVSAPPASTEEGHSSGKRPVSQGDGTPLHFVFSTDNDEKSRSTSSTTWTDVELKDAGLVSQERQQQPQQQQQQRLESDKLESTAEHTDSFELTRYSTQESIVYPERFELATHDSAGRLTATDQAAAAALMLGAGGPSILHRLQQQQQQQRQLMMLQVSNCQLLTTTLPEKAEPLPGTPTGARSCRVVMETGTLRELAEPSGGDRIGRGDDTSSNSQFHLLRKTVWLEDSTPVDFSATSSETASASCPAEAVHGSKILKVVQPDCKPASSRRSRDGTIFEVNRSVAPRASVTQPVLCCVGDVVNNNEDVELDDEDSVGRQSMLLVCDENDALTTTTSARSTTATGTASMLTSASSEKIIGERFSADCRLCADFIPYARSRLKDLKRSGLASVADRKLNGKVCVQKTGFNQYNTALIASLVARAAKQFDSDAEQASYVRLELRGHGFECAVVIGRHFTGCICGQESSRLLLDIGERSCLIFSFFQLSGNLKRIADEK